MTERELIGSSASKTVCGANEDIISDMPKNVIDMILDALSTRDAVRTSVLSRKWQYRWVTTSELIFDDAFFTSLSAKYKTDLHVKNIINRMLLLHTGHIRRFELHIPHAISLKDDVNQWLHFLSRNGIKEFSFLYTGDDHYQFGLELYLCSELTYLHIMNCTLNPSAAFKGFPNLTVLELSYVSISEKFGDAISTCSRLERVSIGSCYGIHNLVVRAPNLKYLRVQVNGLRTIWLNSSTKHLASISIDLGNATSPVRMEKLHLEDNILEFSVVNTVPKRLLPTTLDNLKSIALHQVDFNNVAQIACIVCMIRSSPKLTELDIWGLFSGYVIWEDDNFVEDYDTHDFSFDQLKSVKFMLVRDLATEMALIKLILACSPLLESISITAAKGIDKDKSLSMCKKLMQFGRASPKASIVYSDPYASLLAP